MQGWLRSGQLPTWRQRPRGSSVDRHAGHLGRRWDEGCHNAAQLWREIQEQGFRGQLRTVQRWVQGRRGADPTTPGVGRRAAWPMPSKQRAAWLVVADPEKLDVAEHCFVDALIAASPDLGRLIGLAREFRAMVRRQQADRLDGWLAAAKGSALAGFVDGLARDLAIVTVEHGASRRADQPPEDEQADYVRPRRLRTAASPGSGGGLNTAASAILLQRECGRTGLPCRLTRNLPYRPMFGP